MLKWPQLIQVNSVFCMSVKLMITSLSTVIKSNFHNQSEAVLNHPELAQTKLERRKENLLGLVVNTAHESQSIH